MPTAALFLSQRLTALLIETRRCGGKKAYTVVYPEGYGVLWLGHHPSRALLEDVSRLLPHGKRCGA